MADESALGKPPQGFRAGRGQGGDQAVGRAGHGGPRGRRAVRGGRDVHDQPRLRAPGLQLGPQPSCRPDDVRQAIVINAGNANAATGAVGEENAAADRLARGRCARVPGRASPRRPRPG